MKRRIKSDEEINFTTQTNELKSEIEYFVSAFMKNHNLEDSEFSIKYYNSSTNLIVEIFSDLFKEEQEGLKDYLNTMFPDINGNTYFEVDNLTVFAKIPMDAKFNLD